MPTYTPVVRDISSAGKAENVILIAFTADTYASGLLIDRAAVGCPNVIESLVVIDSENNAGSIFKWDGTNSRLRVYRESAGSYAEASGAQTFNCTVQVRGW